MIKMIIKMNQDKILRDGDYTIDQVNSTIDRIFAEKGMEKKEVDGRVEFCGHERTTDFAYFGKIMTGLKKQSWFIDNADTWLLCSNDDTDDPLVYNEEDLLKHYKLTRGFLWNCIETCICNDG